MTEEERLKLVTKVRQILKIADRTNYAAEAQTALLKAQEIMVKHGLSMTDLDAGGTDTSRKVIEVSLHEGEGAKKRVHWYSWLGNVIAGNFRCQFFWRAYYRNYDKHYRMMFIGLEDDVRIAREVFLAARDAIERLVSQHVKERKEYEELTRSDVATIRTSFIGGFIAGLNQQFKEQVAKNCWALVLVEPEEVTKAVTALSLTVGKPSSARYGGDSDAYHEGKRRGYEFQPHQRLGGG